MGKEYLRGKWRSKYVFSRVKSGSREALATEKRAGDESVKGH
jgi:hypothetical protein